LKILDILVPNGLGIPTWQKFADFSGSIGNGKKLIRVAGGKFYEFDYATSSWKLNTDATFKAEQFRLNNGKILDNVVFSRKYDSNGDVVGLTAKERVNGVSFAQQGNLKGDADTVTLVITLKANSKGNVVQSYRLANSIDATDNKADSTILAGAAVAFNNDGKLVVQSGMLRLNEATDDTVTTGGKGGSPKPNGINKVIMSDDPTEVKDSKGNIISTTYHYKAGSTAQIIGGKAYFLLAGATILDTSSCVPGYDSTAPAPLVYLGQDKYGYSYKTADGGDVKLQQTTPDGLELMVGINGKGVTGATSGEINNNTATTFNEGGNTSLSIEIKPD
jgi:hypothetical protein